jgi:hypothetical protein
MTVYRTCMNCSTDRASCPRLAEIKASIKGASITSVKFRCAERAPIFRPGDRVLVTWPVMDESDGYYGGGEESWPATVISEVGCRFLICVDDVDSDYGTSARGYVENDSLYAKVSALKLKRLDQPSRRVCGLCGIVNGNGFDACWQTGTIPHSKCLRHRLATHEGTS